MSHLAVCAINEEDLMKFNKKHFGLLLILTILTSVNLAEAEDKYTLKIATMKLPPYGWIDQDK